ncbi:MAG: BMP family ABC transporter substrate-binding protein [Actinomycetota bacterium]|nr:BMP family ABC transporter substrate-binding protein [Actinomycetota bacterium]
MSTRRTAWFTVLLVFALLAAACGGGNPASEGGTAATGCAGASGDDISVGLAFDIGGLGDQSFNDAANAGLQRAIEDGLVAEEHVKTIEANATGSNRDDNVVNLSDQECDVIFAVGFAFSEGINQTAKDYPNVKYAVVDGFAEEAENVTNLGFKEEEGSFLVGAAAAMKSKSGTIGFLGGQEGTGLIEKFEAGYTAGAKEVDPNIEVLVEYIGDNTAAFNDPTKGEALSAKMYDAGADVIYHASGASGAGLFKAAVEADGLAIGVDSDQSLTASPEQRELILTSMLKRVDTAVYDTIKQVSEGEFTTGFQVFGLAEDGVDYAVNQYNDTDELLSSDIQDQLDEFKQDIIDGKIKVPVEPGG